MKNLLKILGIVLIMALFSPVICLSATQPSSVREAVFALADESGSVIQQASIITITDPSKVIRLDKALTEGKLIDGNADIESTEQGLMIRRKADDHGPIVIEAVRKTTLPFTIRLSYHFNGKPMLWTDIAGKAGTLFTQIQFQSTHPDDSIHVPFTIQLTIPLNTKTIQILHHGTSDMLVIGNQTKLVYADLMTDSLQWEWEAYSDDWSMDSWEMTLLPKYPNIDIESYLSMIDQPIQALSQIKDGYSQIRDGVKEINQNQGLLHNGYQQVQDGWNQWLGGFQELTESIPSLSTAFQEYRSGLNLIQTNLQDQQTTIHDELEKWKSLESKLTQAQTGFSLFSSRLTMFKAKHDGLLESVTVLSGDIEQEIALAEQVLKTSEKDSLAYQLALSVKDNQIQINDIQSTLLDESKDFAFLQSFWDTFQKTFQEQYLPMIEEASTQINTFITGVNALMTGLQDFDRGLSEGEQGVIKIQAGVNTLMENTKPLVSSQILLQQNANRLQQGTSDVYQNLLLIERTGMNQLILELQKAQSDFNHILSEKKLADSLFQNAETPFYIIKMNFPYRSANIFERFQEKLRLHYNK